MFDSSNQRNKYLSKRNLDKETLEAELLKQKEAIEAAKREHELELDSILVISSFYCLHFWLGKLGERTGLLFTIHYDPSETELSQCCFSTHR